MERTENIALEFLKDSHLEILTTFELIEDQKKFTTMPNELLTNADGQYSIVITHKNKPVGFFLLHTTSRVMKYTENKHALLLTSLSINNKEQGKGYASIGMSMLTPFIKSAFPMYNEIVLAVNHKNAPAEKLYKKVGFVDTAKRIEGPLGEQLIMSLKVT
ncbi:GNAT family N-acetyltransferase [Alkalicoccobacillus plakortidis]|uniref:GNAT family N-acetyltransferase n=1 Tax=Alkalicoccobacillus plakortidis TaxID=444060 RepID=A0ABT0XNM4_9BACI|nr:GNAT family N-acetyltransferase [Alkalicoccobacillus plakortidis]MCM2677506.1 GNAT family N-acetyltransferase [Alkalicoccobacillus plakortidis]